MPQRLDSQSADFAARFSALLDVKREAAADVEASVRAIIADVAARGDRALIELTQKFDRVDLAKIGLRVSAAEIAAAEKACDAKALDALKFATPAHRPPITNGKSRRTSATPTRSASNSAANGPRSRRSGSTCRAAPRPIRPRC